MTTEQIFAIKKNRLKTLKASPKNIKCGGVVRKLEREVANLAKELVANA